MTNRASHSFSFFSFFFFFLSSFLSFSFHFCLLFFLSFFVFLSFCVFFIPSIFYSVFISLTLALSLSDVPRSCSTSQDLVSFLPCFLSVLESFAQFKCPCSTLSVCIHAFMSSCMHLCRLGMIVKATILSRSGLVT